MGTVWPKKSRFLSNRKNRGRLLLALSFLALGMMQGLERLNAQGKETQRQKSSFYIEKIMVLGNKKTRAEVILREMHTRANHFTTAEQLELDRRRIESLGLFNRVQMRLTPKARGYILEILVSEQWYIFPFPILFFNNREISFKKLSYGLGVVHTNFRGRAELLQFSGWLGYNPTAILNYTNPWIFGNARLFTRLQLYIANQTNKTFDILNQRVTEKQAGLGWTVGKRLTLYTSLSITMFYRQIRLKPAVAGQTLDPSGQDRYIQAIVTFVRDHRDLIWYPTHGSFLRLDLIQSGLPRARFIHYSQFAADARRFIPLGKGTSLAFRLSVNMTQGRVPIYDRVFFGYRHRLRGHFSRRLEGEHRMIAGASFRFPIIPVRYFNLDSGTLGPYGQNLRFGISGSIFIDAGTLWFQSRDDRTGPAPSSGPFGLQTRPKKWLSGYGVGLNFHLPYINIFRTEFAINEQKKTELIFDIGVAF